MSLPPPGLPPEVGVRTRFKAVSAELGDQHDSTLQAALLFELGALTELRMGDAPKALEYYRDAELRDPSFRPALFARARLLSESHNYDALLPVLAKLSQASTPASDRASVLVELGCLLDDQLGATTAAQEAFERALAADAHCHTASLMCERRLLAQNRHNETSQLIARRAAQIQDPSLRSALAVEAAREFAATGEIDTAIETLLTALALPDRQLPTLACLAELSVRHARPWVAGRAYEDLGALLAAYAADRNAHSAAGSDHEEIATRYNGSAQAGRTASFYYHRAGRLQADYPNQLENTSEDALRSHERALHSAPDDVHLGLALAGAYQSLDSLNEAQALLRKLRQTADTDGDPRRFAALSFELAELAERQGDGSVALEFLRAAHRACPEAPSINAMLEDRLLDAGDLTALSQLLATRARTRGGAEQRVLLWRAALAADRALEIDRALALWSELSSLCEGQERTAVLRELHGLTARAGRSAQLQSVSEQLLGCALSKGERSALWRSRYEAALTERDLLAARATLHLALEEPACEEWAAHAAWLVGGLQKDHKLLALAHAKLAAAAEQSEDLQLAAAHLTAGGRALLLLDEHDAALTALRRALEIAPGQAYTRGLIERCLRMRGDSAAALGVLQEAEQLDDKHVHQAALLHQGNLAEAAGQLELARRSYDEAVALEPGSYEAQWARLRFAERERDDTRRMAALHALTEREAAHKRPGNAHLELAEARIARGELSAAAQPLSAAIENETIAFEAAASAVMLPREPAADALRPRALSELAEQSSRKTRRALEHERSAELLLQAPADARKLFGETEPVDAAEAWSRFLLHETPAERVTAVDALRLLADAPEQQAEFRLHAARCRALLGEQSDDDALMSALELSEDAVDTLPSALALCEALDAADDPDTRVAALRAWLTQLPKDNTDVAAALARAYTDAGAATPALRLQEELLRTLPNDPGLWESLRVTARMAGDYQQVALACDVLASHVPYPTRAGLLEEAAAILHERLDQHEAAERRLRDVLAHVPDRKPAFDRLHDVLVEREDLDGLLALLAQRIALTDSESERVDLQYERARILRARNERPAALAVLVDLLTRAPAHAGALGLSAEIYATDENWQAAVQALRRLSATELTPAQRRLAIEGSADFLEHNLGDPSGAYRELEKLLALDLADYAVHTRMARLAEAAEWTQPAAEALTRAAAVSRGPQRALLERRAAGLFNNLGEQHSASEALRRALLAHPGDEQAFTQLYSQLPASPERDQLLRDFQDTVFHALAAEPSEPDLLRTLVRTGHTGHRALLEQLGLFTLEALAQATREELAEAERLRAALPERPNRQTGRLNEAQFAKLLPRALQGEWLSLARAVATAWRELTPEAQQLRKLTRLTPRDAHPLRAQLSAAHDVLGLQLGELYLSDSDPQALYPVSSGEAQSWVIGRDFQSPSRRETWLRIAPLVAAARAQLVGLADDDVNEVQRKLYLVLTATGVLDEPGAAGAAKELAPKLARGTRAAVVSAWESLPKKDDVPARLARAVVNVGRRAALVCSGDLIAVASRLADARKISLRAACVTPAGLDLLRFWLSPACAELLEHLGVCP